MNPRFDPLLAFVEWYTSRSGICIPLSPADGVTRVGSFSGIVLYREGSFQAQLWLCDPNSEIPDHAHPDADSVQVYVSGQVYLRKNGEPVVKPDELSVREDGLSNQAGAWLRILPGETHGATIGPLGGSFVTFTYWPKMDAQSVELNWEGQPVSEDHAKILDVPWQEPPLQPAA